MFITQARSFANCQVSRKLSNALKSSWDVILFKFCENTVKTKKKHDARLPPEYFLSCNFVISALRKKNAFPEKNPSVCFLLEIHIKKYVFPNLNKIDTF